MGHRHIFNPSQIFEADNEQGWSYTEQPYMPPIVRGASESSSTIHPVDNMTIPSGHFPSQWAPTSRSSGYPPSMLNNELPHYQPIGPGPSRDPFLHQPASGNLHNYSHHPSSSSSMAGQTVPGVDTGFYDQTIVSGRGPFKRKSPGIPPMGSSSRFYDVGSSSDIHLPADPWQEKHNGESYQTHWDYPSNYGVNSLSIGSEGPSRNVRSRPAVDLETNLARAHLPSNSVHHSLSSRSSEQTSAGEFWGQSLNNAPTMEWNRNLAPPATHGAATFNSDSSFFSQDPSSMNTINNHPNRPLEIGGYSNDVTPNRNHVPQNGQNSHLSHSVRGVRSGYGQRSVPSFRGSSSNSRPGHLAALDEGQQVIAESYPPRHPHPFTNFRLRNVDRSGRSYASSERYRSFTDEANFRDRLTPEGLMVVDHSAIYGSRTLFDQHRDMRLDIDNMSYEDLLALGERIGSVSTGLSDGLISKSLTESIFCSSDLCQDDEGMCVICLEEYKNMDDVGTLKACRHDFHVSCIRKWLSMKNVCPICKKAAVDEGK